MKIEQIQIRNFLIHTDTGVIPLDPRFNVIVGPNDAGKSALLSALELSGPSRPHKDNKTETISTIEFDYSVDGQTLFELFKQDNISPWIPHNPSTTKPTEQFFKRDSFVFRMANINGSTNPRHKPSYALLPNEHDRERITTEWSAGRLLQRSGDNSGQERQDPGALALPYLLKSIFRFSATRTTDQSTLLQPSQQLGRDASNLAAVISNLQGNPRRFERLNKLVNRVFPHINGITTKNLANSQVEIRIWTNSPDTEDPEATIPLHDSGTGVGQAIAMLYAIVATDTPQILLIDEPNSFLYPGAMRRIIEIFREHDQHQYVLSTHSPDVLSMCLPAQVITLSRNGRNSKIQTTKASEALKTKETLRTLGVRVSDFFGFDRVLWVEGPTEENCLKLIWKDAAAGTAILPVLHTGDFERRDADRILQIYTKLTAASALTPSAYFLFDREERSDSALNDLRKRGQGRLEFIGKRMFENYLLNPRAIASVLNVDELVARAALDKHLGGKNKDTIDGARVLNAIFWDLAKTEFNKPKHAAELTKAIISEDSASFSDLTETLDRLLGQQIDPR